MNIFLFLTCDHKKNLSYNFNLWWKPWTQHNHITSDVWSQITSSNLLFSRTSMLSNNCAVEYVPTYYNWFLFPLEVLHNILPFCFVAFTHVGCSRSNQDQLCWISNSKNILWISPSVQSSCPRSFGRKVSLFTYVNKIQISYEVPSDACIWPKYSNAPPLGLL